MHQIHLYDLMSFFRCCLPQFFKVTPDIRVKIFRPLLYNIFAIGTWDSIIQISDAIAIVRTVQVPQFD
jgi:hypothetical protein